MRAVIYVRQSLDRTGEGAAVDRQREDCERLAHARGWDVVRVSQDNDTSAAGKVARPGFDAALADLSSGAAQAVVAWDLSRLTRNARDRLRLIDVGRSVGAVVALVRGSDMDLSTPAGRLTADVLASVAQHEIEQKGDRQRRASEQRRERGEAMWTRRPFGYDRQDGRAVIVVREAEALQRAAADVLGGATLASIARRLDAEGLPTSTGGRWSVTSLRRALLNPRIVGSVTYEGRTVAAGQWPAILTPELQDRVAEVLKDPKRKTAGASTTVRYLLSGRLTCGRCEGPMFASPLGPKGRRWMVYRCRTGHLARRLDLVDELVTAAVLARLRRPDAADLFVRDVDVDALRAELGELTHRREALVGMIADGLLPTDVGRERAGALTKRMHELDAALSSTMVERPGVALTSSPDVEGTWSALPIQQQRAVIDVLCRVRVLPQGRGVSFDPAKVEILWKGAGS